MFMHHVYDLGRYIAEESIPKTSSNKKHNKSWFNGDCKTAIRSRKAALMRLH